MDLLRHLGKREEKCSLRARDPREARRLARQGSADFDRRCQRLRDELRARYGEQRPLVLDDAVAQEIARCAHSDARSSLGPSARTWQ